MQTIVKLLVNALALLAVAYLIPGITVASFQTALVVAFLLAIINTFIRPVLVILTLPITLLTLGLFTFVINGGIFFLLASYVPGFHVDNFWIAILGSALLSIVSWFGHKIFVPKKNDDDDDD